MLIFTFYKLVNILWLGTQKSLNNSTKCCMALIVTLKCVQLWGPTASAPRREFFSDQSCIQFVDEVTGQVQSKVSGDTWMNCPAPQRNVGEQNAPRICLFIFCLESLNCCCFHGALFPANSKENTQMGWNAASRRIQRWDFSTYFLEHLSQWHLTLCDSRVVELWPFNTLASAGISNELTQ